MVTLVNVVWFILFGWESALTCFVFAVLFSVTIVGLPIGRSLYNLAILFAFPYGKQVVRADELEAVSPIGRFVNVVLNIIWFPVGAVLTAVYFVFGLVAIGTVVGIPIGIVMIRLGSFLVFPMGAKVVDRQVRR
jgi:uncharacterized membrane protein YccF (DUF307 family)